VVLARPSRRGDSCMGCLNSAPGGRQIIDHESPIDAAMPHRRFRNAIGVDFLSNVDRRLVGATPAARASRRSSVECQPSSRRKSPVAGAQSRDGSSTRAAYNHVALRARCPYLPWSTRHVNPSQSPAAAQPTSGGSTRPWRRHASEPDGCSRTPPNLRTAASAAAKHPRSSPGVRRRASGLGPPEAYLPHLSHGGCATAGHGPAYLRASRDSSHASTPGMSEYTPSRSTNRAAITRLPYHFPRRARLSRQTRLGMSGQTALGDSAVEAATMRLGRCATT
jgi:hypothetical protein